MRCRVMSVGLALGLIVLSTGCVERRFVVESNPAGAMVFVNNQPYGPTPVDIPFIYYGTYDITLVKDGFQTKKIQQKITAPWYQYPGIDFISEVVVPLQFTDSRPLYFELDPIAPPNLDQLKMDADELRRRGQSLPAPRYPDLDKRPNAPKPRPSNQPLTTNPLLPALPPETPEPPPPLILPGT